MIRATVGILTYNSEHTLRRTLESVRDFSDILIADGGSTDNTLAVAAEYNARVIAQLPKTGDNTDHPISDFAAERNNMLDHAREDWFLWLDSDEYISAELSKELETITTPQSPLYHAYEIPVVRQSPDASVTYRSFGQDYQVRFFNRTTGGRFQKPIHERFFFDETAYKTGRLNGAWYVPISKAAFACCRSSNPFLIAPTK